jgi:ribosomal protein S18 acetylase RimI-like enzyme
MISVVDISMEHVGGFHDAVDAVARERRFLARTEAPPREQMQAFVLSNIVASNPHVVALDGSAVVGWADLRRPSAPAMGHCAVLGMGVISAYRGMGVGRSLLSAVVDRAWKVGLHRVELEVRVDNGSAIGLYERFGFRREGVKVSALLMDDCYIDMLQMGLLADSVALRSNNSLQRP